METLFNDSETFQKDRPTKATDAQIEKMYFDLAEEVIYNGWSDDDEAGIISDLKEMSWSDSGFELAKHLDRNGWYGISVDLIEWLDDLQWKKRNIINDNVKTWVKAHDIKPTLERGTKILVVNSLNRLMHKDAVLYICGFSLSIGCYLVDKDKDRKGGTVIPYEQIHENCITKSERNQHYSRRQYFSYAINER